METKVCKLCGIEKSLNEYDIKNEHLLNFCKDCRRRKRREKYAQNREQEIRDVKIYQSKNKDAVKKRIKAYQIKNKEKIKEYNKKWEELNKERRKEYCSNLRKKKKQTDKAYKLKCNVKSMINNSFTRRKYTKKSKNYKILGCNYDYFINYLLQTYKDNYGIEWDGIEKVHIDHIKPLKYAKTEEEVIKLCHYTNLQLLKEKDNLEKSFKLDWELSK